MTEIEHRVNDLPAASMTSTDGTDVNSPPVTRTRPSLFQSKTRTAEDPKVKSLRLLLNKLTPGTTDSQLGALLAFDFNQDLISLFSSLMLARVSTQRTLSCIMAKACVQLRVTLALKNPGLADFFTTTATNRLETDTEAALLHSPDKLAGLLSLAGALAIGDFCPGTLALKVMTKSLETPTDTTVDAVCSVFKSTISEILGVHDVKKEAEELIVSLTEIWHTNSLLKRTQFQLQDIVDSKTKLLVPKIIVIEAPLIKRKSANRAPKRVSFPTNVTEPLIVTSIPPQKSICRTHLNNEARSKIRGVVRELLEDHDVPQASRTLTELVKTLDLPAISELVLQVFKYMLVAMSMNQYQEVCLVMQQLIDTELVSKADLEDG